METRKEMGRRIREIRKRLGMNQEEFGRAIGGTSKSAVSSYEAGDSAPSPETMIRIAEIGGISLDWLLAGKDNTFEGAQEPPASTPGGMDAELVRVVIEAVEEALGDLHLELKPDKKAQLVITLCEMFEEEKQVDKPTILRLIKLAA